MATFYPVGGEDYTLASSISSTATSITLTSFTLPITDQAITMATANSSILYGTLQPGTTNSEFISFTGITQNASGTATLTGVTRGLDREYPYTEASAFKLPHPGQSIFILSDAPQVFNSYTAKVNAETISGKWTFPAGGNASAPVSGASYSAPTDDLEYASKKYVDDVAIQGSPDATNSVKGITKLSVAAVSATDPIAVGDNDTRVPTQGENDALAGTSGTPSSSNKYVTNDDTTGTGSVIRQSVVNALIYPIPLFGDGSDGAVTISSNTTLTRDMYYTNLTVNSTFILSTDGYKIYCSGTLTNNGTIRNNGSAGSTSSGGEGGGVGTTGGGKAGGGGGAASAPTSYGGGGGGGGGVVWIAAKTIAVEGTIQATGGAGANGVNGGGATNGSVGTAGTSSTKTFITTGTGGAGGQGSSSAGGAGGTVTTTTTSSHNFIATSLFIDSTTFGVLAGGAGGGGGGADVPGGGSGGGGGGQGGVIYKIYQTLTTSGTNTVTGGAGGSAVGTGVAGSAGSSGISIAVQVA